MRDRRVRKQERGWWREWLDRQRANNLRDSRGKPHATPQTEGGSRVLLQRRGPLGGPK
jgi:hypothetical protein